MQQLEFRAMGSRIFAAIDSDGEAAKSALARVPGWFEDWAQKLSRFRDTSELNLLNSRAGGPVQVSQELFDVVKLAVSVAEETGGLVVPTLLPALQAAGYDRSFDDLVTDARPASYGLRSTIFSLPRTDWHDIRLDEATRTVQIPADMALDLGGVGKGWAASKAAGMLSEYGPALVDAGGDVAVSGSMRDGSAWPIGVSDPFQPESDVELLAMRSGGVATSGRDFRRWKQGGVWRHHIIDPRTSEPAVTDVLSATVVAPTLEQAEMAAKAAFILGSTEGIAWIEAREETGALLVLEDGQVVRSSRFEDYTWS
jgi:FAD:protein FMN transferase